MIQCKIIDEIRSSKVDSNNSWYDYSELINENRYYVSPLNYVVTDESDKKHKIEITVRQTTKADEYALLQNQALTSYGVEFILSNFAPFWVYSSTCIIANALNDSLSYSDLETTTVNMFDQTIHAVFDTEYKFIDKLKLVERIQLNNNNISDWFPDNLHANLGIGSASDLLGIGNVLTIYNYCKSVKAIESSMNSNLYSQYMFNVSFQIVDENLGTYIYSIMLDYDHRDMVKQYSMKMGYSDDCYQNPDSANHYIINNKTEGVIAITGKRNII